MNKETVLDLILYLATGLVIAVVLILTFIVIPLLKPDKSQEYNPCEVVTLFWIIALIHLLLSVALIYTIFDSQRGGRISKELIVATGIVLILFGLAMSNGAFAYLSDTGPGKRMVAISMFICIGFNFLAGVLTFVIAMHSQRLKHLFNSDEYIS